MDALDIETLTREREEARDLARTLYTASLLYLPDRMALLQMAEQKILAWAHEVRH